MLWLLGRDVECLLMGYTRAIAGVGVWFLVVLRGDTGLVVCLFALHSIGWSYSTMQPYEYILITLSHTLVRLAKPFAA